MCKPFSSYGFHYPFPPSLCILLVFFFYKNEHLLGGLSPGGESMFEFFSMMS